MTYRSRRRAGFLHVRRSLGLVAAVSGLACTGAIGDRAAGQVPGGAHPAPPKADPGPTMAPPPMGCGFAGRRIWPLTPEQYGRTVEALLPAQRGSGARIAATVIDGSGFSNGAGNMVMTEPHVTEVLEAAVQLAGAAMADPTALAACLAQAAPSDDCLRGFLGGFASRAFRRDLDAAEIDRLLSFVKSQPDRRTGLEQFFLYLFGSPQFLFRTELGPPGNDAATPVTMTAFEKAAALSYFLTDGPPDAELSAAARAGALDARAMAGQARRLLARPETSSGLIRLLHEQFQTDTVVGTQKDPDVFKDWTDALARDLAGEADQFVRQVLWQEGARLSTLLAADFSMLNATLASYYGAADGTGGKDFHKVSFRNGERAGLVTQAGLMASQALDDDTSPVRRGLYVRQALLCQPVPDPPANVNAVPPVPDGKRQQRERLAAHGADPSCAVCHAQMDPIGLAFERYDGVGRYRTMDVGRPLDTGGTLTGVASELRFTSAVDLLQGLARAPEVERCFVRMAFGYGHGRGADAQLDRCALDRLGQRFQATGGDVVGLAAEIAADESFFVRR